MKRWNLDNERFPHTIKVYRETKEDAFSSASAGKILYEGKGRSFTNTTTDGDVVTLNMRKAAIPPIFSEWEDPILAGDIIEVWIGEVHEYGVVTDWEPANFGTEIYWKYVRN